MTSKGQMICMLKMVPPGLFLKEREKSKVTSLYTAYIDTYIYGQIWPIGQCVFKTLHLMDFNALCYC